MELFDRFGYYLFREQHYDFPLAWDEKDHPGIKAYFVLNDYLDFASVLPIGIAVFHKLPAPLAWQLAWVWIHPFERGHGWLSRAWPAFKAEFGDFTVQRPVSAAMKAFLAKQDPAERKERLWGSRLIRNEGSTRESTAFCSLV
ncbi:MAG TPA: hypothetical protein VMF66_09220 [Candidatus Acidoferrum sp.]|nr:hypothetical protein [Candidatus Acidoferrum sp.]